VGELDDCSVRPSPTSCRHEITDSYYYLRGVSRCDPATGAAERRELELILSEAPSEIDKQRLEK